MPDGGVTKVTGRPAVDAVIRYGATRTHLETALHELHLAMASSPWGSLVAPLGRITSDVAQSLQDHADAFQEALTGPDGEDSPQ